jgi:RNA polymerase sigma-70 factor (ECF subfamily)
LDRLLLDDIFASEKESTRTMAVLHYVDKLTLEETAECVGLSVSGVRKRLRRLRERGLLVREGGGRNG